jgi:hypothetical protein
MEPSNFDELTKALANSSSRRHALRIIVTTAVGGLLGLTSVSTAFGRPRAKIAKPSPSGSPGNSKCAQFCAAVFGANTPAANQCTSDAARNKPNNLCQRCGGNKNSVCCQESGGFCNGSVAGATCCPTGQHCQNGDCVPNCTGAGETCSVGTDCCSGSCCGGTCCDSGNCCNGTCCGSDESCFGFGGCCKTTQVCNAGSTCCDPLSTCVPSGRGPGSFCCPTYKVCNGGLTCCPFVQVCCGGPNGTTCCDSFRCINGVCT